MATEYPTAWDAVVDHLATIGVEAVFGLPGDDLTLAGALESSPLRVLLCRDQRNAVFMATGYALAAARPGAAVVGKGPAVTNALTGLLEAEAGRVPLLLFATGTAAERTGTGAFQELDQIAAVRSLAKWAVRIDHPDRVCAVLDKATIVATSGTPGPVYVELPEPVATAPVTRRVPWRQLGDLHPAPPPGALRTSYRMLRAARRPLLLVGGGARHRNPDRQLERLAERFGAGLATTASGRGTVDETHPLFCGLAGLYALPPVAALWHETDLVVAVGSRLEETATLGWPDPATTPTIQVTVSERDIATERPGRAVLADAAATVAGWLALADTEPPAPDPAWGARVRRARQEATGTVASRSVEGTSGIPVARLLSAVSQTVPPDLTLVQENGLQDMWSYFFPYWSCGDLGDSAVPSEQTSLGFGAAAAIGVAYARPDRPVVALVGDGAFNLFATELPTLATAEASVLYLVLDNGGYGWLQANLDQHSPGSRFGFLTGRRGGLGAQVRAYGLGHARVEDPDALAPTLRRAWRRCAAGRTTVVEVAVDIRDVPPGLAELAGDAPATTSMTVDS